LRELYDAVVLLPPAIVVLAANRRRGLVAGAAIERVMLAVTAVTGCPACSWAHTRMALREGVSPEEISSLLAGNEEFVPLDEATAIAFAQHYADSRALPEVEAYAVLERAYGRARARTVIAAVQVILVGNIYGIPYSAYRARRQGTPYQDSTVGWELGMLGAGLIVLPVALGHGLVRWATGGSVARFQRAEVEGTDPRRGHRAPP
jgi:AhpD family alkylhydroperoxidase